MENWGFKIKYLREQRHWTQDDLEEKSGVSRETIAQIETGRIKKPAYINEFAKAFDISPSQISAYFYGSSIPALEEPVTPMVNVPTKVLIAELHKRSELSNESDTIDVPIIGYITAGIPVPTEQQDLGKIPVSKLDLSGVSKMSGVFGLIVSGDSLIGDEIQDRYTVIVDPNPDIIDGKIYVVQLGTEYVARHLHRENGFVILTSSNGKYEKLQVKEVEIKGRVVLSGNWKKH